MVQIQSSPISSSHTSGTPGSHLVDAVVAVSLFGGVFADAPPLGAAHHPHRLPCPPVLGLGSEFVIEWCVAVEGQRPADRSEQEREGGRDRQGLDQSVHQMWNDEF